MSEVSGMFSTLSEHENQLESLSRHRVLSPTPEFLIQEVGVGLRKNLHL